MKFVIEDKARNDVRFRTLASALRLKDWQTWGILITLWMRSQELGKVEIQMEDLGAWMEIDSPKRVEKIAAALERSGYLKAHSSQPGIYRVAGNESRIQKIQRRALAAKKAASKRWSDSEHSTKIVKNITDQNDDIIEINSMRSACDPHADRMRSASKNEKLSPARAKKAAPKRKSRGVEGVQEAIAHYCSIYKHVKGNSPSVLGSEAGCMKTIVKTVGVDKAKILIEAYFQMPKQYFRDRNYKIQVLLDCLTDVESFVATGKFNSRASNRSQERRVSNAMVVSKFLDPEVNNNESVPMF